MKEKFKVQKALFVINIILLLPGVLCWIISYLPLYESVLYDLFAKIFWFSAKIVLYLRLFYISYMTSAAVTITYIITLVKHKFPKKETATFIILLIICILELLAAETIFLSMMGI